MRPLDELNAYLDRMQRRLRAGAAVRGALVLAAVALGVTVLLVAVLNALAFASTPVTLARLLLWTAIIAAVILALWRPIKRLNKYVAARRAEQAFPDFQERLLTVAERERENPDDPFLNLLAADTMRVAERSQPEEVAPTGRMAALVSGAVAGVAILIYLIAAGPGYWGHGASLLWAGAPKSGNAPFYDLKVQPGDAAVRRNADQLIKALPMGFSPREVRLYAKYASGAKWEPVAMNRAPGGAEYEFLFASLAENVEYYVQSGAVQSKTFAIRVLDLPRVKNIKVSYRFPSWTGMQPVVEEKGGDLRAVEGTEATLEVETDKAIAEGAIIIDSQKRMALERIADNRYRALLRIDKDGMYHVAAIDRGEPVRLTEDFFIEVRAENAPEIRISRPGRDYKASPIEEVSVQVEANDDFGLNEVALHYSVNGGPEQTKSVLARKGQRDAKGSVLLALEDFKLVPGDLVSVYATAKDARATARTDMYFIEAQPFEREYSQAQQSGGGGGGGGQQDQNNISARQKEIIAATFNQTKEKKQTAAEAAEVGKFLSDVQAKLKDQALSLATRMQRRELTGQNQEFASFQTNMKEAAAAMGAAADKLKGLKWQTALPDEQKALQHLLRAEAIFRQIQVAFGSRGGGGGGGGAGRDLENLFDLELDTEKNQYETGSQRSGQNQREQEVDEALQKLEQLARRQQELAQQQQKNKQTFQQRWQQEMLRREAEELQRQMERLSRGQQGQQGQQQQSQSGQQGQQGQMGQQGQQGSRGQQGQSGQQSGQSSQQQQAGQRGQQGNEQQQAQQQGRPQVSRNRAADQIDPRVERALERLKQATEDMRQASSAQAGQEQSAAGNEAEARRAAERLREAADSLSGMRRQDTGNRMDRIAERAEALASQQRDLTNKLRQAFGNPAAQAQQMQNPGASRKQNEELAGQRQGMADELARLEKEMQETARSMASSERPAATKLREALGDMQQNELGLRLKYSADAIRNGMGQYAYLREQPVTQMLEKLRDQVKEAQRMLGQGGKEDPKKQGLESALDRVERMRQQMQAAGRQGGQQQGQGQRAGEGKRGEGQSGEGQGQNQQSQGQQGEGQRGQGQQSASRQSGSQQGQGQRGQSGQGNQGGQQPGSAAAGGQGGQQSGQAQGGNDGFRTSSGGARGQGNNDSAMNDGSYSPTAPGNRGQAADPRAVEQAFREGMRDLQSMRSQLSGESPELAREVNDMIRELQRLDPARFKGNPELVEQLRSQVLAGLEQIELQLRRQLDDKNAGQVRSTVARPVPPGYQEPVAEYFRRLSKGVK